MVPRSLPRLKIAVACNADWNAMAGNDRARVCSQCCQTVYNVERLRPREVAELLERHGDRMPCLRLLQRPDGTIVTRGCLTWVRDGVRRVRMGALSVAAMAVGFWSNVLLWRGRLHSEPEPLVPAGATFAPPRLAPPPPPPKPEGWKPGRSPPDRSPRYMMGAPVMDEDRRRLDSLRHRRPPATETQIREALAPVITRLQARATDVPRSARVDVRLDVKASGRVVRARVIAPPEFPPRLRKMIEDSVSRLRLPRSGEDYQTEFPLVFASDR